MIEVLSLLLVFAGGFFLIVSGLGLVRLPDLFTRLHTVGIADTLGVGLFAAGFVLLAGFSLATFKLILIILFLLLTGPVASHALAKAALHGGERPKSALLQETDPPWNT